MQPKNTSANGKTPDYDLHMPKTLSYPIPVGILSALSAGIFLWVLKANPVAAGILSGISVLVGALYVGVYTFLKRLTDLDLRLEARKVFLDGIPWEGDENVLDVGCGNGILTMGVAKHLKTGVVTGIDIWTAASGDNRLESFIENARIEGVLGRVEIQNEDVRHLPFEDASFDVIVSGLTIHHLGFDTQKALKEMTRVLKPGGWMAIYDEPSTIFYAGRLFQKFDLQVKKRTMDMLFGEKPLSPAKRIQRE